ncbi:unnamed protein product [Ixodes persulcatus]
MCTDDHFWVKKLSNSGVIPKYKKIKFFFSDLLFCVIQKELAKTDFGSKKENTDREKHETGMLLLPERWAGRAVAESRRQAQASIVSLLRLLSQDLSRHNICGREALLLWRLPWKSSSEKLTEPWNDSRGRRATRAPDLPKNVCKERRLGVSQLQESTPRRTFEWHTCEDINLICSIGKGSTKEVGNTNAF